LRINRHKFNAKRTIRDGINFDSEKEGRYYDKLKIAKISGDLLFFLRQVPFDLPGKTKYRLDFMEFWADGSVRCVDVKGYVTAGYKAKKKQVEALYPVIIEEV